MSSQNHDGRTDPVALVCDPAQHELLGDVLRAIERFVATREARRRGGPGAVRALLSLFALFTVLVVKVQARRSAFPIVGSGIARKARLYLSHPPAGWAAP